MSQNYRVPSALFHLIVQSKVAVLPFTGPVDFWNCQVLVLFESKEVERVTAGFALDASDSYCIVKVKGVFRGGVYGFPDEIRLLLVSQYYAYISEIDCTIS
jgi:hypothetical protein